MNQDFLDLLRAFIDREVPFLIVGADALGVHGRPRATGDLDVWVDASATNAPRVMTALADFGVPLDEDAFIKNKRATGRTRDLGDIESLG